MPYEYDEYEDDVLHDDQLYEEEIEEIQEEYRRKKLIESLIGPSVSTVFHVLLIVILALLMVDKVIEQPNEIKVILKEDDPPLDDIDKPELEKVVEKVETFEVQLMNVSNPEAVKLDNSIEDTPDETPLTDNALPDEYMNDTVVSPSAVAQVMRGSNRKGGKRGLMTKFGANKDVIGGLPTDLNWLARVQSPDGSWGSDAQSAYTGLAVLTFLARGETHVSKNYGPTVKKALKWLVNDPIDTRSHHAYPHAIKTYALCEAYAMTGLSMLEDKMNECVKILVDGQQDGGSYDYNYKKDQGRQDLSFAGWNFQALKAAQLAGCEVPGLDDAVYKAIDWLKKMASSSQSFAYTTANNDPANSRGAGKWTMRAVGVLCLQWFGAAGPEIKDELDKILKEDLKNYNYDKAPKRSLYGWYYATNAMFQAQGKYWDAWKMKFQRELTRNRHKEGYWEYPGANHIPGDDLSRKVYATTLNLLQLSVFYRNLPTGKGVPKKRVDAKAENELEEEGLELID